MKYFLPLVLSLLTFSYTFAQEANVVLFTENGERFTVILNGARQNETPQTQVKITGLNAEHYKLKVIFEDQALGTMDKSLLLAYGTERAYSIKKNNKGEYVLRPVSESPIEQAPPTLPNQTVVVYNPNPAPAPTQVTVTETTTTTVNSGATQQVNMSVPGVSMNVSITDGTGGVTGQTVSTTTYSTTTTTSGTVAPAPAPVQQVYVMPGYNGPVGCPWPMSDGDFQSAKNTISSKSFEDSKLQIAKQVFGSNCLLSSQVRDIMGLFSFEESKLEFAKYAYGYTYDLGNYYKVNDAFTFESSIDELNDYIRTRR